MSCRSVPGMNVPMGLANIDSGLSDDQVQSLVHQLRHEYNEAHLLPAGGPSDGSPEGAPSAAQAASWTAVRSRLATRITAHPTLRPQRRAGLLQRIGNADTVPSADMVYAAERIRERAIRAARLLDDHLATEAARAGIPDADAYAGYEQGRLNAPGGRQSRATDEQRRNWPGLPLDPRTRYGLTALAAVPDNADGRRDLITEHPAPHTDATQVTGVGYHPGSRRLEVITAEGHLVAYREVSPALASQLSIGDSPDSDFRDHLVGNPAHQYRDAVQAAAASIRRRCPTCGQFTGATHNCLGRRDSTGAGSLGSVQPAAPAPMESFTLTGSRNIHSSYPLPHLAAGLESNRGSGLEFPIDSAQDPAIRGSLSAELDADDQLSVNSSHLVCPCERYSPSQGCEHTEQLASAIRDRLTQEIQTSRTQVAEATAAAITTRPATEQLLPDAPNLSTFSYTDDPARFTAHIRQVMAQPADQRVPWLDEQAGPVLYGFGAGRDFGAELEFDTDPAARNRGVHPTSAVGQALFDAQFTRTPGQRGYHAALNAGYNRSLQGGWTYEHDGSVTGGEVVTPILSDTPETWTRLREVCGIITRNSGVASRNTGSHITVSSPEYAGQAVRLTRFLRLMHHHQSDLHMMAAAGHDRRMDYAGPIASPPLEGYTRINEARQATARYTFVNLAHISSRSTDPSAQANRVEFRLWDGSLEPARIQAQIKMSAALLDYSTHNRTLTVDPETRAGSDRLNPDHDDFVEQTQQIRGLIDQLYRRDADKEQAAAMWAAGLVVRNGNRHSLDR